jgi:adenylate cyclase
MSSISASLSLVLDQNAGDNTPIVLSELLTIGRAPENDLVLSESTVSRRHARIVRRDGHFFLEDLGSAHGTYISGEKIASREIRAGDLIMVGPAMIRVIGGDGAEAAASPAEDVLHIHRTISPTRTTSHAVRLSGRATNPETAVRRFEALLEIGLALQGERDIGRLIHKTVSLLLSTLEADRCGIFLRGENGASVLLARDGSACSDALPVSRSLLARAMEKGEALVVADAARERRIASASLSAGTLRSAMVAPLWGRERILGAMVLEHHGATNAFLPEDLRLLVVYANLAGTAMENARLVEEVRRETTERMTLARFLSPAVADEVRRRGINDGLRGERCEITVLFTDLRNFTSLSETLPPDVLLEALNRGFKIMIDAILEEDGTIDKFTGDGILAFFGAPLHQEDHAARAVRAALRIREECRELKTSTGEELPLGIGLASGAATVGPIGSERRKEYTAMGDVVNVAARLVGCAAGGQILSTQDVIDAVGAGFRFRSLGTKALKGKNDEIAIAEILGVAP